MAYRTPPIIVIKKVVGHGGHHGGAWKVAYADFVTALMALFIVLWLMSSSEQVKKAVAGYFNDHRNRKNHRRDAHRRTAKAQRQARAGDQGAQGPRETVQAD
jgi:chemotaxis protein MotB